MKNVIFLAPPASGKGTFSDYLIKKHNYNHLSTGNILRQKALTDSSLASYLQTGELVDDDTILNLVKENLSMTNDKPFILDGVPRTLNQALKLNDIIDEETWQNTVVILIVVKESLLKERIINRFFCPNCGATYNSSIESLKPKIKDTCDICNTLLIKRSDDNLNTYNERYQSYLKDTYPLIKYYEEKHLLKRINNEDADISKALQMLEGVIND